MKLTIGSNDIWFDDSEHAIIQVTIKDFENHPCSMATVRPKMICHIQFHIGDIPLRGNASKLNYTKNLLHVPTIIKSLPNITPTNHGAKHAKSGISKHGIRQF